MLSLLQKKKRWRILSAFVVLTMLLTVLPLAQPAAHNAYGADKSVAMSAFTKANAEKLRDGASPMSDPLAEWSAFRGNNGSGITPAKTVRVASDVVKKWVTAPLGDPIVESWGESPPNVSSLIIAEDHIFVAANDSLRKVSKIGKIEQSVSLAAITGYSSFPVYGDGMVFVPLSDGTIQAFDADTMDSLWISAPPSSGSYTTETPLLYNDGYLYGGVYEYISITKTNGSFFAIDVTDDNPSIPNETKACKWEYTSSSTGGLKGYYWSGATAVNTGSGDYIVFAGDDGIMVSIDHTFIKSASGTVTSGVVKRYFNVGGSVRSGLAYNAGFVYVTTKEGKLWKVAIAANGALGGTGTLSADLSEPESTAAPIIYGGNVYAVSGDPYETSKLDVFDNATLTKKSTTDLGGYSQSSPLLSGGYNGKAYLYMMMNDSKDDVIVVEDGVGSTAPKKSVLHTPGRSYAMSSVVADKAGVLYFTDGAGKLTALGNKNLSEGPFGNVHPVTVKVKFNANGGKALKTKEKTVAYGSKLGKFPTPTHKKSGSYGFIGWFTAKSGGIKVTENTVIKSLKDITYYAHWGKKYTVKFNANKGKVKVKNKKFTTGLKYGSLPKATRTGYKFTGWYTKKSGGKKITASAIVTLKKNATYYAHWKKK